MGELFHLEAMLEHLSWSVHKYQPNKIMISDISSLYIVIIVTDLSNNATSSSFVNKPFPPISDNA